MYIYLTLTLTDHNPNPSGPMGGPGGGRPAAPGCKIYVGNLSWDVKWQHLKDFFGTG
jgi:RNA recognition motif-containing protein